MKKILAAVSALLLVGAFAFAEGYINANDLEKGSITEEQQEEDGFVLLATPAKPMEVHEHSTPIAAGDEIFTQSISTKGTGKATERIITFPVKAGETITVFCNNSGSSGSRPIHVAKITEEGLEEVLLIAADTYSTGKATIESVKAPSDGIYGVYSTSGGSYIHQIIVK